MRKAKFIVFEGIDGSGKSTISNLLFNKINSQTGNIYKTFEPTNSPIGSVIKNILNKFFSKKDIFKSFRQGGHFLKRNHEGSGLGLALAKGLLDLYETELLYKSHEKVGSVFYFTLPISS